MNGQMNIYDFPEYLPEEVKTGQKIDQDKAEYAFKCFNEHCQHRGWCKGDEDTGKATWMCSLVGRQQAKGWSDWRQCTIDICPLLKEEK